VAGSYLSALFERAFITGLHEPNLRPTADEWESALVKTVDLIQPCLNQQCQQKWYVFDNTQAPQCPFCGTPFKGSLPILNLYSNQHGGSFKSDNHRLMIYTGQSLFKWHIDRKVIPNERILASDKQRVGYFIFHDNQWLLVNERMPSLFNLKDNKEIAIGEAVPLLEGTQLLFAKEQEEGRLAVVQLVKV
jgi:hypothetical protein